MNPQIYQPDMGVDLAPCFFQDEEIPFNPWPFVNPEYPGNDNDRFPRSSFVRSRTSLVPPPSPKHGGATRARNGQC